MNVSELNISKFEEIICLYGCDESKWPQEFKNDIVSLLDSSADAKEMLNEYSRLEGKLDEISVEILSDNTINSAILDITSRSQIGNRSQKDNNIRADNKKAVSQRANIVFYRIAASVAVIAVAIAILFSNLEGNLFDVNNKQTIKHAQNKINEEDIDSLFSDMQNENIETFELLVLLD